MTTVIISYPIAYHRIDQGWQGGGCNQLVGSQQAEEDILHDVFCLHTTAETAADKCQQLVTVSDVIVGDKLFHGKRPETGRIIR